MNDELSTLSAIETRIKVAKVMLESGRFFAAYEELKEVLSIIELKRYRLSGADRKRVEDSLEELKGVANDT